MEKSYINEVFEDKIKKKYPIQISLKDEQLLVIHSAMNGHDTVVSLPTGYGKSFCYYIPPLLFQEIRQMAEATVLVISPLKALVKDQVAILEKLGIRAACILRKEKMNDEHTGDLKRCAYTVVFASPEAATTSYWRKMFISESWQQNVVLIAIDECHCVSQWGEDFRPEYRTVSVLRSIFDCPIMALSATMNEAIYKDITQHLVLENPNVIAILPDRPNIYLHIEECTQDFEIFNWLIVLMRRTKPEKVIIFCKSIKQTSELFGFIVESLGEDAYAGPKTIGNRKVEMFHASLDQETKDRIIDSYRDRESKIRCLVATVAFGMGIDIPDIRIVINWGAPSTLIQYWQQIGRCSRDGERGFGILYVYPRSVIKSISTEEVREFIDNKMCYRSAVMRKFAIGSEKIKSEGKAALCIGCDDSQCKCEACNCCNNCKKHCCCSNSCKDLVKQISVSLNC